MTPRMRTINAAAEELKRIDPETNITPHAIRNMVLSGVIPHVRIGNKRLICLEQLLEYLSAPTPAPKPTGGIRVIPER